MEEWETPLSSEQEWEHVNRVCACVDVFLRAIDIQQYEIAHKAAALMNTICKTWNCIGSA